MSIKTTGKTQLIATIAHNRTFVFDSHETLMDWLTNELNIEIRRITIGGTYSPDIHIHNAVEVVKKD